VNQCRVEKDLFSAVLVFVEMPNFCWPRLARPKGAATANRVGRNLARSPSQRPAKMTVRDYAAGRLLLSWPLLRILLFRLRR
jgi:hypothetical protein